MMRRVAKPTMVDSGADFSGDMKFRYRLWRVWDKSLPPLVFIMLNPSVAGRKEDDPTATKCIGFAQRLGYGGIEIFNLFAFIATDPKELAAARYPVGVANDTIMRDRMAVLRMSWSRLDVIYAWGANARGLRRAAEMMTRVSLWRTPTSIRALRLLSDGTPEHPLMLPYDCKPIPIIGPR